MNEADLPATENAPGDTVGKQTENSGRDAGLPAALESAAQLSSANSASALAGDILHGADAIAEFLYGDRKSRRKVYHLVENGHIPFFKIGTNICTRKSVLVAWIERQERRQTVSGSLSEE